MDIRCFRTIPVLAVAALAAVLPATAHAATPAQIHRDAADGELNGSYSMAELRAADQAVSSEQREYYAWEDVYRDYVSGMGSGSGSAPPAAARPDSGSGTSRDVAPGSKSPGTSGDGSGSSTSPGSDAAIDDGASGAAAAAGSSDSASGSGDSTDTSATGTVDDASVSDSSGGFPFALLFALVPLLVLGVGGWRAWSTRDRTARSKPQKQR